MVPFRLLFSNVASLINMITVVENRSRKFLAQADASLGHAFQDFPPSHVGWRISLSGKQCLTFFSLGHSPLRHPHLPSSPDAFFPHSSPFYSVPKLYTIYVSRILSLSLAYHRVSKGDFRKVSFSAGERFSPTETFRSEAELSFGAS